MTILVRRARLDDAEAFAATMGHPRVLPQLMQLPYTDAAVWRERLPKMLDPEAVGLLLVAELDGQVVGNAGLQSEGRFRRRHAMGLGIAVDPTCWGRGVGSALMTALLDWADRWAWVLRVELKVYTDNHRAIALYRRHGFVLEGTHRAYALRDGAWADVHAMARLHPNPPQLPLLPPAGP